MSEVTVNLDEAREKMAQIAKLLVKAKLHGHLPVTEFALLRQGYSVCMLRIALQAQPWWSEQTTVADAAEALGLRVFPEMEKAGKMKLYLLNNKL